MTNIFYKNAGDKFSLSAQGHAEYTDEAGKDIVCSAVSTLIYTLANAMDNFGTVDEMRLTDGDVKIVASPKIDTSSNEIMLVYEVIVSGFQMLEKQYPENVKVNII